MRQLLKFMHIGLAVCAVIYAVGLIVFHDSETAMSIVGGTGLVACFGVYLVLDARYRAREARSRGPR